MDVTAIFEKGAGGLLNKDKTEIVLFGKWTDEKKKNAAENNIKGNTKILKVRFGPDSVSFNKERITNKMEM